jgi:hypothetical protein
LFPEILEPIVVKFRMLRLFDVITRWTRARVCSPVCKDFPGVYYAVPNFQPFAISRRVFCSLIAEWFPNCDILPPIYKNRSEIKPEGWDRLYGHVEQHTRVHHCSAHVIYIHCWCKSIFGCNNLPKITVQFPKHEHVCP